jgi:hypothetical protein
LFVFAFEFMFDCIWICVFRILVCVLLTYVFPERALSPSDQQPSGESKSRVPAAAADLLRSS